MAFERLVAQDCRGFPWIAERGLAEEVEGHEEAVGGFGGVEGGLETVGGGGVVFEVGEFRVFFEHPDDVAGNCFFNDVLH